VIVLGIVGPIAAGKSVVLQMLAELGATVVSADDISRQLLKPGSPLVAQIAARFGGRFIDDAGHLKRKELARLIFADAAARRQLNALTHPPMVAEIQRRIEQARADGVKVMAVEAAVLEQMGALDLVDKIVMVTAPPQVRRERLIQRDALDPAEASRRIAVQQQLGLEDTPADFTIVTDCPLECTRKQVQRLWETLQALDP